MLSGLQAAGHEVLVVSYDRGARNLRDDFGVMDITGLRIVSRNNKVSMTATMRHNLGALGKLRAAWRDVGQAMDAFAPALVITDFEPMTAYAARRRRLPLVTIDNQHRMRFMAYPPVPGARWESWVTRTVIRLMVPRPTFSLITTFYFGATTDPRAELFPPILRDRVRTLQPTRGDHILVYATQAFDALLEVLRAHPQQSFRVYGFEREDQDANIRFRPFSVDGFLTDLSGSAGVVATAGFTLMTEALYLRKPLFALPMQGQFEQMLNGHLLQHLGYGCQASELTAVGLGEFLQDLPRYREALAAYPEDAGEGIKTRLANIIEQLE